MVRLVSTVNLWSRFELRDLKPETKMTVTDDKMTLIQLVEKQADGDLVREMLTIRNG